MTADSSTGIRLMTNAASVSPGFFRALGIPLLRGRDFVEADDQHHPRLAIVNSNLAEQLFPNGDAIGMRIRFGFMPDYENIEIVGIVNTHRHDVNNETPLVRLFVPFAQGYTGNVFLHLRLATQDRQSVAGMISTTRSMLRDIDPNLPIIQMSPYVDLLDRCVGLWIVKLGATLFGAFGLIALLLAVVGVYGVKAYAVACRTREIGIRMALGAHRKDVFALIMRQGALQTALAVSVGLLLSLAAGRVLAQILYQVSPSDPFALIASSVMLTTAALLACFLPARRATHVNPITALRTE